jgi:hypothetical protein
MMAIMKYFVDVFVAMAMKNFKAQGKEIIFNFVTQASNVWHCTTIFKIYTTTHAYFGKCCCLTKKKKKKKKPK